LRIFLILAAAALGALPAQAGIYRLEIARQNISISGKPVSKITVNGGIPGPRLTWREGEDVTVAVINRLTEDTSVHWHGILLPGGMDGVPGLNGFGGIKPGETFTYRFTVRQSGSYWYHAHSNVQEQEGVYGALAVLPKSGQSVAADKDYTVVFSDFSEEKGEDILSNLKSSSDYYQNSRRTLGDFFNNVRTYGFLAAAKSAKEWGKMRMLPTDLSDVGGYVFLTNGAPPERPWEGLFAKGDKVRLRFVNASAMTIFDVRIPGAKMTVIAARHGMAPPPFKRRPRALLTMADMGGGHRHMARAGAMGAGEAALMRKNMQSGWSDSGAPPSARTLSYKDLRFLGAQADTRPPGRTIDMILGGNMERYIWTMNGKKYENAEPVRLRYGERVRIKYTNETMMAHPIHLHGMFTQLENGQSAAKMPNKHTVLVPPGESISVILTANEPGEWAFHCHLLYHMLSGMMTTAIVSRPGDDTPLPSPFVPGAHDKKGGRHAH